MDKSQMSAIAIETLFFSMAIFHRSKKKKQKKETMHKKPERKSKRFLIDSYLDEHTQKPIYKVGKVMNSIR